MVTGDIQAIEKQRMSEEELCQTEKNEIQAVEELIKTYPKTVHGYSYEQLLKEAVSKDTVGAQLVSYLDKLDALCESLHDLYAGNISLLRAVVFYTLNLPLFPNKYPMLKELLASKESSLTFITDQIQPFQIKFENYTNLKPYTEESVLTTNDFPFYTTWKKIVIEHGKMEWLIDQKEF